MLSYYFLFFIKSHYKYIQNKNYDYYFYYQYKITNNNRSRNLCVQVGQSTHENYIIIFLDNEQERMTRFEFSGIVWNDFPTSDFNHDICKQSL